MNAAPLSAAPRALDDAAAARTRTRLQMLPQAPWLHGESAQRMAERLAVIKQPPQRVIDWSGPAGGAPQVLTQACPGARIHRLWPEGVAIGPAAWWQRLLPSRHVAAVSAAEVPDGAFDMVWSVMNLHWSARPELLMQAWRRALATDGFLMFNTLGPGTLAGLRDLYRAAGWGSPMAALVDMHDLGDMLVHSGFADPVMDQETVTLTWASPEAMLAELRSLGGNADPCRLAGCRTPRWRARLHAALTERADGQGRIAMDFELVYGHAFRTTDAGPAVSAQANIALDDMKLMLRKPKPRQ